MLNGLLPIIFFVLVILAVGVPLLVLYRLYRLCYVNVPQGSAVIIRGGGPEPQVRFISTIVSPFRRPRELMVISPVTLSLNRRGRQGLLFKDGLKGDITLAFQVKVNCEPPDVLKAASRVGVEYASDHESVNNLFSRRFENTLEKVGRKFELAALLAEQDRYDEMLRQIIKDDEAELDKFRREGEPDADEIARKIIEQGEAALDRLRQKDFFEDTPVKDDFCETLTETIREGEMDGYRLIDVTIDHLAQTPKHQLDPYEDASVITKINEDLIERNINNDNRTVTVVSSRIDFLDGLAAYDLGQETVLLRVRPEQVGESFVRGETGVITGPYNRQEVMPISRDKLYV